MVTIILNSSFSPLRKLCECSHRIFKCRWPKSDTKCLQETIPSCHGTRFLQPVIPSQCFAFHMKGRNLHFLVLRSSKIHEELLSLQNPLARISSIKTGKIQSKRTCSNSSIAFR